MKRNISTILAGVTALCSCFCIGCKQKEEYFKGLYDDVEAEAVQIAYTKPNMMYDFEETASLHRNLYYHNLVAEVSLNTDEKYVTCGNASMKLVVHGRADKGYWSMLYFVFDDSFSDFRKIKTISLDILYEHPDNADTEYSIGGTGSNANYRFETTNKVYAKSGEWYTFTIHPNEKFEQCCLGGTWRYSDKDGDGVYMPEDQLKAMNNLYLSFKPFKQGQKPVTVYLDNIYVEYFNEE